MLEADSKRGCRKHIRIASTLIRLLVYVLEADLKGGCIQHIYIETSN